MANLAFLEGYSSQTTDELIALEGRYRIDSIVMAFDEALGQKAARDGTSTLTTEELTVLAVEAFEREVNNGGFHQFFTNTAEYAPFIVESLRRIKCPLVADNAESAIGVMGLSSVSAIAIEKAANDADDELMAKLSGLDDRFYSSSEDIAERLFEFIKSNCANIRV